jgi:hypothetical protein
MKGFGFLCAWLVWLLAYYRSWARSLANVLFFDFLDDFSLFK